MAMDNTIFNSLEGNKIKCASFNVRGLRNYKKRSALLKKFKFDQFDVIALQETHLLDSDMHSLSKQWSGPMHYTEGTNRSKGLCTLFHANLKNDAVILVHKDDRVIISKLSVACNNVFIINVYAPCTEPHKRDFIGHLNALIKEHIYDEHMHNVICLGDFNMVADNDMDIVSGRSHSAQVTEDLQNFLLDINLVDSWRLLHPQDRVHSWSGGKPITARRLDYIFVSKAIVPFLKDASITSIGFSDHRLVSCLVSFGTFKRGKGLYKLNTELLKDQCYINLILKEIDLCARENFYLNPHLKWEMIKATIKEVSQQFSKSIARAKVSKQAQLQKLLNLLETSFQRDPKNHDVIQQIAKTKMELEIFAMNRTKAAQIRAGIKWIEEGEKCTKYFLSLEKKRSACNTIHRLKNTQGREVTKEDAILEAISSHYEQIYKRSTSNTGSNFNEFVEDVSLPTLSETEVQSLDQPFSEEELFEALKSMKDGSAPGSDGLPVEFYKFFWNSIKGFYLESLEYSLKNDYLSPSQRLGVISLIHKGKGLATDCLHNWRPISLTNVDYKILTKALSRRLSTVIDKLVGKQQVGFMKGRQISTILREIDDVLQLCRRHSTSGFVLAVDYKQAFDSISTDFILKALEAFGFGPTFLNWVRIMNSERLACVKNGGHVSRTFNMLSGVRQGCPVSPQLFVLAVEVLAQKIQQDQRIKGLSLEVAPYKMKVRQYADDTTLFLKDTEDLSFILDLMDSFSRFSGLHINFSKSYLMSTDGSDIPRLDHDIEVRKEIKILGIYFSNTVSASKIENNWLPRVDKIRRILGHWSRRDLSIIGKIHVIKVFCLSQINFVMQSLLIPDNVLTEINRICFRFLWKKRFNNKRAFEKVKRKTLCTTYEEGGLKMIDIFNVQESIFLTWVEKLLSREDHDWKSIARHFYKQVGGMSVFRSNTRNKEFKGYNLIGNDFWEQALKIWLKFTFDDSVNCVTLIDPLFNNMNVCFRGKSIFLPSCIKKNIITIGDMFSGEEIISYEQFLQRYGIYPRSFLDYNILHNAINTAVNQDIIRIPQQGVDPNMFFFRNLKVGKVGRKIFFSQIRPQEKPICLSFWKRKYDISVDHSHWRIICDLKETRLKVLWWKIIHNIYPTNILLSKMKIKDSVKCEHCQVIDFIEHFFYSCSLVIPLWREIERDVQLHVHPSIKISEQMVLLGATVDYNISKSSLERVNLALAIGKLAISKFKYGKGGRLLEIYRRESLIRKLWDIHV